MIILKRYNEQTNLIHLVIGPETHSQLDIVGIICLDLDALLAEIPDSKARKNVLAITRSECEAATAEYIKEGGLQGLPNPLSGEMAHVTPVSDDEEGQEGEAQNHNMPEQKKEKEAKEKTAPKATTHDPRGTFVQGLKCTKCGVPGSFVRTGEVPKCSMCIKIDTELAKKPASPAA